MANNGLYDLILATNLSNYWRPLLATLPKVSFLALHSLHIKSEHLYKMASRSVAYIEKSGYRSHFFVSHKLFE